MTAWASVGFIEAVSKLKFIFGCAFLDVNVTVDHVKKFRKRKITKFLRVRGFYESRSQKCTRPPN